MDNKPVFGPVRNSQISMTDHMCLFSFIFSHGRSSPERAIAMELQVLFGSKRNEKFDKSNHVEELMGRVL